MNSLIIVDTLSENYRRPVAELLYEAFSLKLHRLELFNTSREQTLRIYVESLNLDAGVYALEGATLVGVLAIDDGTKTLATFPWSTLTREFGFWGALLRKTVERLEHLTDRATADKWHVTHIAVAEAARGRGIGALLIQHMIARARAAGCPAVWLDVVDTNPRARALYTRLGFVAQKTKRFGFITRSAGFTASTTMVRQITAQDPHGSQQHPGIG